MRTFQAFSTTESTQLPPAHKSNSTTAYSQPEDFLEIEVCSPVTHLADNRDSSMYTDYEVVTKTNLPSFSRRISRIRRRYSDFELFRKLLLKELELSDGPISKVTIPSLPGKILLNNRFNADVIEERRRGLDKWLKNVAGHPLLQLGSRVLVRFIEKDHFS
ncbi:hypothetical protein TBLA_0E00630 [Henningerozyma blattae CBS 6284]|uniref:Sorting nexin-3 n=1 Tax=Henningerozyma blattae (strain ATCC 34711 / CBS 6284 / DSM 70876 / NBRC 10599 / NRRL Y-10934 / UCD 77-7) TaxID=1071380 RepID=I2H422_HENB6|nr:hypothetical protein TBLA_0E00630 [Tetrapisispora blattae CBS 6284]CCH61124.1 hypothetical protein TBLA_0E00630 [Tetrapisispora blattae CBS 6284]